MNNMPVPHPVIPLDYPDPDIIRVGDRYYMISTTMHFFPGGELLTSSDLIHWSHHSYIYDRLDSTPAQKLKDGQHIYGKGMWAATLRYHLGTFYVLFAANDTKKTYLYRTDDLNEPWKKHIVEGFYHDASLLFDDDDRKYIVYGNTDIRVTELNDELTGPKNDGISKIIVSEPNPVLGYEGSHIYKIDGKYFLFLISSLPDQWFRVQSCFVSDRIDGPYTGDIILEDDSGFSGQGVAQGGIVDTPEGNWYMMLFQDMGAAGRMPVLVPLNWKDGLPVVSDKNKIPESFSYPIKKPVNTEKMVSSDEFKEKQENGYGLQHWWQFNHEPDQDSFSLNTDEGYYEIRHKQKVNDLMEAVNTLTQSMTFPYCQASVRLDFKGLNDGDVAGISAFQGDYGFIAVTKENGQPKLLVRTSVSDAEGQSNMRETARSVEEWIRFSLTGEHVDLMVETDFRNGKDVASFYYRSRGVDQFKKVGPDHQLSFKLDHFTGCRFGLFSFATEKTGGYARFKSFIYSTLNS